MINGVSGSIVNVIMNNLLITYASKTFNSLQVTEILAVLGASGKMFFFCFICFPLHKQESGLFSAHSP